MSQKTARRSVLLRNVLNCVLSRYKWILNLVVSNLEFKVANILLTDASQSESSMEIVVAYRIAFSPCTLTSLNKQEIKNTVFYVSHS